MNEKLYALTTWGGTIIVNQPSGNSILHAINDIERTHAEAVIILTNRVEYYWQQFKEYFTFIEAGGGIVRNANDEYLFIHRRGKWDLPKGKKDEGESIEECALREVEEETGLKNVQFEHLLKTSFHVYTEKDKHVLKQTSWISMYVTDGSETTPQAEEDITAVKWLKKEGFDEIKENTFPSVKAILKLVV